ncbi:MAG: helix-turn-helix domain-containing protein [Actinomycetota bacterium]|nr:helix-turn-helix domain-containing protein [Actinomycetota bacterium]
MPAQRQPPPLRLRRLGNALLRLRDAAELTRENVTERTHLNVATLYRIETGQARPQRRTLITLLDLYEVPQAAREELFDLARQAGAPSWLQTFPDELPPTYRAYIEFEGEAAGLLNYESLYVPGLFQIREYARATIQAGAPTALPDDIDRRADARMARQAVLTRTPPLRLWAILDEAALHRPAGGAAVMRAQLEHLAGQADIPHVTLQVIPYAAGPHPGMVGSFAVLRFAEPAESDVVYVEGQVSDLFLEKEADVRQYVGIFEHLRALALSPDGSVELIKRIAREQFA